MTKRQTLIQIFELNLYASCNRRIRKEIDMEYACGNRSKDPSSSIEPPPSPGLNPKSTPTIAPSTASVRDVSPLLLKKIDSYCDREKGEILLFFFSFPLLSSSLLNEDWLLLQSQVSPPFLVRHSLPPIHSPPHPPSSKKIGYSCDHQEGSIGTIFGVEKLQNRSRKR